MVASANTAQRAQQENMMQRARLLNGSQLYQAALPPNTLAGLGQQTTVRLNNVGVTQGVWLNFKATINITSATTVSAQSIYALVSRISVQDYSGNIRVDCSGPMLWAYNSIRNNAPFGFNNQARPSVMTYDPAPPTGVANNQIVRFALYVPFAYSETDLRGALLTQTSTGEARINIEFAPSLVATNKDTCVYSAGAATLAQNVEITAYQHYRNPAVNDGIGSAALPAMDLATVHELVGMTRKTDVATGSEALIDYPNMRSVFWSGMQYFRDGVLGKIDAEISRFVRRVNGASLIWDASGYQQALFQRTRIDADILPGFLFVDHFAAPIQLAQWGQVQHGITPSVAITDPNSTYITYAFASLYPNGAAMSGFSQ